MTVVLDADLVRAASHRHMFGHLIVPFAAGAVDREVIIDATGVGEVDWNAREPELLVALAKPLEGQGLRVSGTLDPGGANTALGDLEFFAYTESGAALPLYRPPMVGPSANPFTVSLAVNRVARDGTLTPIPAVDIASVVTLRLIEGVLARLLYVVGAEKQRIRRQAREIIAMRRIDAARDHALDRIGGDLSVPRFADQLSVQPPGTGELVTTIRREPDAEYRPRLRIYRPFLMPNRRTLLDKLNGPGVAASPNAGLMGAVGVQQRFSVLESNNPFAIAIHLVAAGPNSQRTNFLKFLRAAHLVRPLAAMPADKYILRTRPNEAALRTSLVARYTFPAGASLAPRLATVLDRVGRCRAALGQNTRLVVTRAQSDNDGSRWELGLGVTINAPSNADLDALVNALNNPNRAPAPDAAIEGLLRSMTPATAAADPEGSWFFNACGVRTVHRLSTGELYLSHFSTFGMAITGASQTNVGTPLELEVRYHAPGDPGSTALLATGLASAGTKWTALGRTLWTVLSDAAAAAKWDSAQNVAVASPAGLAFAAAGLPVVTTAAPVVARLKQVPVELLDTIVLPAALSQNLIAGQPAATNELRDLVEILRGEGLASALPLVTGPNEVIVVVGAVSLPEAGINLSERRATGFRWYQVPIKGKGGTLASLGQKARFTPAQEGLTALVALGYLRRGLVDPYEFRIDLPQNALLSITQYEFLMNLLEHVHPAGVEINTFNIRKHHVFLDPNKPNEANPLKPSVANTFRLFRRRRHRGEISVTL